MKSAIALLIFFVFLLPKFTFSQCDISASASDTLLCHADSVDLFSNASIATFAMFNNFNNGTIGTGWAATSSATITNSMCVPHPSGTYYLWMANAPAPRSLESIDFDLHEGGTIQWDMRYALEDNTGSPCEGPDEAQEGVALQYSTSGGAWWVDWKYFQPNGVILTTNPYSVLPGVVAGQPTAFTDWHTQTWTIPEAAKTTSTRFRWFQASATDETCDNWGVDNIQIQKPTAPSHCYWTSSPAAYISDDTLANPTVYVTETTTFTVTITNGTDSCTSSVTVEVAPSPTASFATDTLICTTGNVSIEYLGNAPSSAQYLWNFDGGTIVSGSGQGPYSINWPSQGTYEVSLQVIIDDCVSDSVKKTVTVYQMNLSASNDTTICQGNPVNLFALASGGIVPYTYSWSNGPTTPTISVSPNTDTDYEVVATDQYLCKKTESVHITVIPLDGNIDVDTTSGLLSHLFHFEWVGSSASNFHWDFGDGSSDNGSIVDHIFPHEGTFTVTLTVIGNPPANCERTLTILIFVYSPFNIKVPNVFTPNGDGFNDRFFITAEGPISNFKLIIYNRWGKEVFVGNDVASVWDGSIGNTLAPSGTYYFIVEIAPTFEAPFTTQGTITLLRE